jgi:hypothetical protein
MKLFFVLPKFLKNYLWQNFNKSKVQLLGFEEIEVRKNYKGFRV